MILQVISRHEMIMSLFPFKSLKGSGKYENGFALCVFVLGTKRNSPKCEEQWILQFQENLFQIPACLFLSLTTKVFTEWEWKQETFMKDHTATLHSTSVQTWNCFPPLCTLEVAIHFNINNDTQVLALSDILLAWPYSLTNNQTLEKCTSAVLIP